MLPTPADVSHFEKKGSCQLKLHASVVLLEVRCADGTIRHGSRKRDSRNDGRKLLLWRHRRKRVCKGRSASNAKDVGRRNGHGDGNVLKTGTRIEDAVTAAHHQASAG